MISCRFHRHRGFSLVELLIVMIVVAILATIGYTSYLSAQKKGRDSKRKTDLAQIQRALESYINDYSIYPVSDASGRIVGCGDNDTACTWGESLSNASNESVYLATLPKDTVSGYQYFYEFVEPNGYRMYARLENAQDADIPTGPDGVSKGVYQALCGTLHCNYVVSSENVASPTVEQEIIITPTSAPTATNTPTTTPSATPSPTPLYCWSSDGTTCDSGCSVSAITQSSQTYATTCACQTSTTVCGGRCAGSCTNYDSYPNCGVGGRRNFCWPEYFYYTCAVSNFSYIYTGSGTCSSTGSGTCYKRTNQKTYYSGTASCCGTSSTCSCGTAQTGYTSYVSCTYLD